jgi:hypothetical protein
VHVRETLERKEDDAVHYQSKGANVSLDVILLTCFFLGLIERARGTNVDNVGSLSLLCY